MHLPVCGRFTSAGEGHIVLRRGGAVDADRDGRRDQCHARTLRSGEPRTATCRDTAHLLLAGEPTAGVPLRCTPGCLLTPNRSASGRRRTAGRQCVPSRCHRPGRPVALLGLGESRLTSEQCRLLGDGLDTQSAALTFRVVLDSVQCDVVRFSSRPLRAPDTRRRCRDRLVQRLVHGRPGATPARRADLIGDLIVARQGSPTDRQTSCAARTDSGSANLSGSGVSRRRWG